MEVRTEAVRRRDRPTDTKPPAQLPHRLAVLLLACCATGGIGAIQLSPEGTVRPEIRLSAAQQGSPAAELRAAVATAEAGDRKLAHERLAQISVRYPLIADYADLMRLRLRLEAHQYESAVALGSAANFEGSPLESEWEELLGTAFEAVGNAPAARAAWARAAEATKGSARLAALHTRRARSFAASGDLPSASVAYLEVWTDYPQTDEAEIATAALDAIARRTGVDPRTGVAYRKRGDAFFRARANESALADYEAALAFDDLKASERRRAKRQRAHTLFRLRRYTLAAEAYGELPPRIENRIERARSVARAGDPKQGARDLEEISRGTRGNGSLRALYLAALLWDGEGEGDRARPLFDEVVRRGGRGSSANAALWHVGWSDYRAGRMPEAAAHFEQLLTRERGVISALRARYWLARARGESGDLAAAQRDFESIAREFPFSYYGWRARRRAGALPRAQVPPEIPGGTDALGPDDIARPLILLEAGLETEAGRELDALHSRATGLVDRLALSNLYATTGNFHQSQRLIVAAYSESLARGPVPSQVELWWHAWPAPFAEGMSRATSNGDWIEPGLVYALMREESGYRPAVVSVSGARGLLQIMPETGERLARELAIANFDTDELFVPDVNLRMGSHYLRTLSRRFPGRISAAIASYNAGPEAVGRWTDPALEDDEWVETIPYSQTQNYVKRVLRSLYAYRVLY
jgi:soluble lytic murein transglycosylase